MSYKYFVPNGTGIKDWILFEFQTLTGALMGLKGAGWLGQFGAFSKFFELVAEVLLNSSTAQAERSRCCGVGIAALSQLERLALAASRRADCGVVVPRASSLCANLLAAQRRD